MKSLDKSGTKLPLTYLERLSIWTIYLFVVDRHTYIYLIKIIFNFWFINFVAFKKKNICLDELFMDEKFIR